jgi:hypothetical protein
MKNTSHARQGCCTCAQVGYEVTSEPFIVHCRHYRGCQKNSGSAFAINALFYADRVKFISGKVEEVTVPTPIRVG